MIVKEYFSDEELSCRCGCGLKSHHKAVELLYAVRLILRMPIVVNSAIRCQKHNKAVGGAENSAHLCKEDRGAFDIVVCSKEIHKGFEYRLIQICQFVGFNRIGIKDNTFLHIDNVHMGQVVWGYSK